MTNAEYLKQLLEAGKIKEVACFIDEHETNTLCNYITYDRVLFPECPYADCSQCWENWLMAEYDNLS